MADIGFLPPGLRGYLAGEQINQQRDASGLQQLLSVTQLQQHLDAQRQQDQLRQVLASDLPPEQKQAALMKIPAGMKILNEMAQMQQRAAQTKNYETQAPLHQAQTLDLVRKMQEGQTQGAARTGLASLLMPQGYMAQPGAGRVDVVAPNETQALEMVKAAEAAGQPLTAGSPNPATLRSLAIQAKMSGPEMTALGITQPALTPYQSARLAQGQTGLEIAQQRANQAARSTDSARYTNVQSDGKGGFIGLSKATGKMEQIPQAPGVEASGILASDAIEQAASRYLVDGTLPTNLGRGTQGASNIAAILSRSAEIAKERGDTGEETRIRQIANKANSAALAQVTRQKSLILAFENTAVRNADLALAQSEITDRPTQRPAIDRWIMAGKKQLQGDPAVAKLDLAVKSFANEYARVVTTVTGGGVTSDTARAEIDALINSAQTKEQLRDVINFAKQEMNNRKLGYEHQESELRNSMRSSNAPAAPLGGTGGWSIRPK